jgi:murein DD-endopeptidase MepM/ murein hydrolase activator NlpD
MTIYGHLSSVLVHQGDSVSVGDKIGVTGNSGFSSAPHLHFEYRPAHESVNNGYAGAVDPLPFLMNTTSNDTAVPPADPELEEAKLWAQENKIMGMTALDQPMLRQDVLRVLHRLYVLLKS